MGGEWGGSGCGVSAGVFIGRIRDGMVIVQE